MSESVLTTVVGLVQLIVWPSVHSNQALCKQLLIQSTTNKLDLTPVLSAQFVIASSIKSTVLRWPNW